MLRSSSAPAGSAGRKLARTTKLTLPARTGGFITPIPANAHYVFTTGALALSRSMGNRGSQREAATDSRRVRLSWPCMPQRQRRYPRLTQPLVRRDGALVPTGWDEALEATVAAFRNAIDQGPEQAFGMFSCSKTTNELNFAVQKFARTVIGSNNIDSCNRT